MVSQNQPVLDYIQSRKKIMEFFRCDGDFYIRPMLDAHWIIKSTDNLYILTYWLENGKRTDAIVVRRKDKPLIFESEGYTMVIGIDCVKIGFVFCSSNKMDK